MKNRRTMAAVTLGAVLSMTACTSDPAGSGGSTGAATPAAPAASTAAGTSPVSAKDVCTYLDSRLPTLRGIGSEVGAMANLTVNLYSWYEKRGAVPTGREIDDQTRQECPATRTEVLKLAGMESFERL